MNAAMVFAMTSAIFLTAGVWGFLCLLNLKRRVEKLEISPEQAAEINEALRSE